MCCGVFFDSKNMVECVSCGERACNPLESKNDETMHKMHTPGRRFLQTGWSGNAVKRVEL
jgi:hypothetical protein